MYVEHEDVETHLRLLLRLPQGGLLVVRDLLGLTELFELLREFHVPLREFVLRGRCQLFVLAKLPFEVVDLRPVFAQLVVLARMRQEV